MTIRTSLYPMGYRQTGSPQPTGDTPGNLLGLAYCYENYDDSNIRTTSGGKYLFVKVKEDVFRYDVDLSSYSGDSTPIKIAVDFSDIDLEDTETAFAIEVWIKTRPDMDNGIMFDELIGMGGISTITIYKIVPYEQPEYKQNTTKIQQLILFRTDNNNRYQCILNSKTLEIA